MVPSPISPPPWAAACLALTLGACAGAPPPAAPAAPPAGEPGPTRERPVLTGELTREAVEAAVPDWVDAEVAAEIDAEAARALAGVAPGAEVAVYFGTWCGDSRRELPRLWRALDEVGSMVPFDLELVGVDRAKSEPADRLAGVDLRYVPTFVVRRDGREVGRIVETSPLGIERDLLALLTGQVGGVISASRPELVDGGPAGREP
jgi:thiol-disulfide isomerase/thioredoxin